VSPGNVTVGAAIRQKRIGRRASLGVIGPAVTRSGRNASAGCWRRWASARAAASARPARVASTAWRTLMTVPRMSAAATRAVQSFVDGGPQPGGGGVVVAVDLLQPKSDVARVQRPAGWRAPVASERRPRRGAAR
jgi:hypothetical protein